MPQELENIIKQGEGQTVDFKESGIFSDPFKLAKLMVAFANNLHVSAKHGGLVLIGVRNDGSLEGMKAKKGHEEHLMNIARDRCEPSIVPQFEVINLSEGDVYVLTIPKMTKYPHAVKLQDVNAYYIRVGTTVRVATPEELQELFVATGRPTINQVIQRVRESVPSISKAYRSVLIAPEYLIKNMIQFNREIESWLSNTYNHDLVTGDLFSTQDGVVFKFRQQEVPDFFAKVTREGIIYYREPIKGDSIYIGQTINVVGKMLEYAQKVYDRFNYRGLCIVKLELENIKGMPLTTDSFHFPLFAKYTFDEDRVLLIEREASWVDITQNPASVVESIIVEFCRSFGFSISEEGAKKYVALILNLKK